MVRSSTQPRHDFLKPSLKGMFMASLADVATRHLAAGVDDLDELARLCEQETGRAPSLRSLMTYRSNFRRHGLDWLVQRDPEAKREASRRHVERHRDATREKSREWGRNNPDRKRETNRRWLEANRERSRERNRQWKRENAARALLGRARANAKQRGREVTITEAEVEALLAPGVCSLTGLRFHFQEWDGVSSRDPWAPSLDRIDTSRGYVTGNVRVVLWIVNYMRGDYPDDVVAKAASALAHALRA